MDAPEGRKTRPSKMPRNHYFPRRRATLSLREESSLTPESKGGSFSGGTVGTIRLPSIRFRSIRTWASILESSVSYLRLKYWATSIKGGKIIRNPGPGTEPEFPVNSLLMWKRNGRGQAQATKGKGFTATAASIEAEKRENFPVFSLLSSDLPERQVRR